MTTTFVDQLAGWLQLEEELPVGQYKEPSQTLVNRLAVRTVLGREIGLYAADAKSVAAQLEEGAPSVVGWGDVAAAFALLEGSGGAAAMRCVAAYRDGGAGGAESDDTALAAAIYLGDLALAAEARERRIRRDVSSPTRLSAELFFLLDHVGAGTGADDPAIFSAVRGIEQSSSLTVGRSAAAFVCALAASTKAETRSALSGAMQKYDQLSRAEGSPAYALKAIALELPPGEKIIRLDLEAKGKGVLRGDVIKANELVGDLLGTFDSLKKNLDATRKKSFDKLRRDDQVTLELSVKTDPGLDVPRAGLEVLASRVAAALQLLQPRGYALRNVVTRVESP